MTKRRGHGEGSIYFREDRNRWVGLVDLGWVGGKRQRKSVSGRTKKDAYEALQREQQRLVNGLPPSDGRQTTAQFVRWWLDKVLPGTVSHRSEETYRWLFDHYVIPALGHIRLAELAPAHVTEMMSAMATGELSGRGRPLSPQTQNMARKRLARALRRAEQEGLIGRNAAAVTDGPKLPRREGRSLTKEQAQTLLGALKAERLGAAYAIQLALGLRRGEVLGLRWEDIELDAVPPVVRVRRQVQRYAGAGLVLVDLKTPKSRRDLVLPIPLLALLRTWRSTQATECLAARPAWRNPDGLVFTTPIGTPVDPDNYRHRLSAITVGAGLGHWNTHELRHSAGSLLFAAGEPMKIISEMLGHSSERVTSDVYVHTAQAARVQAAAAIAEALWSSPATEPAAAIGGQFGGHSAGSDAV